VENETGFSWLRDWRVWAAIGAAAVAGFLVGLLVFFKPWRLAPNLGDVPTWLAAVFAAAAGWVALSQLRILRKQVEEEARRSDKRDHLLNTQLAESEARSVAARRGQAEEVKVELTWSSPVTLWLINNSSRPIADIKSRLVLRCPTLPGQGIQ